MAQETLQVTAVSTLDGFTLGAGASKVAAVALPDDGDTSYISAAVNNTEEKYQVAAPAVVTANDLINFVRIVTVARSTSTLSSFFTKLFYSAGTSTAATHTNVPTSYTTYSDDFTLAPDGGAWTLTKLQSLFASVRMAANRDMRVTSFYVVVDYTAGQNVSASEGAPGTQAVSVSAAASVGEVGAGTDALTAAAAVSAGEQGAGSEGLAASASASTADVGAGSDAFSLAASAFGSEAGAGSEGWSLAAEAIAGESGAGAESMSLSVSAATSEQGCGSEGVSVEARASLSEHGAGQDAFGLAAYVFAGEGGAGSETFFVTVHVIVIIHGGTHATSESGRAGSAVLAPNVATGLLESNGRTGAEV